ncbi:sigma-70 family RNA polymerase sigma factor [Falsibacillus albus]|uniref:Sigma-70 family RNA polymerase sigma factor n=1 Tax=Falsibacillus albus TaxID=2478915 RepID=A0A3L7JVK5_9BACI|nr:sigma-70 family RNA polymerase sigma factor [Falsibacillus albus]RLQ94570.1 sigma-70 family RNA polymerase sigma factor [Falsibacillus albus]
MKRLIFSYVGEWQQPEDLTQEVFITVFLKIDTFKEKSSLKTWIYKIAVNKTKDYLRSWHYKKTTLSNNLFFIKHDNSVEEEFIMKERSNYISTEVFKLPIKYREIILLYYYKDFSLSEIAAITNINSSTVRTRLARGRNILERKLGGIFDEE